VLGDAEERRIVAVIGEAIAPVLRILLLLFPTISRNVSATNA
jgi:hypothetical protein